MASIYTTNSFVKELILEARGDLGQLWSSSFALLLARSAVFRVAHRLFPEKNDRPMSWKWVRRSMDDPPLQVQCLPTVWFQGLWSHCIFCSVTFLWDLAQLEIRNSQKPLKHTLDLLCEVESKHILCKTFCLDILRCHQGDFLLPSSWKTTRTASEVLSNVTLK